MSWVRVRRIWWVAGESNRLLEQKEKRRDDIRNILRVRRKGKQDLNLLRQSRRCGGTIRGWWVCMRMYSLMGGTMYIAVVGLRGEMIWVTVLIMVDERVPPGERPFCARDKKP